jgi:hypothetical protein
MRSRGLVAHPALRADAEAGHVARRRRDPPLRALETVLLMHQPEIERRLRPQPQPVERREMGVVVAVGRYIHPKYETGHTRP